MVAPPTHTPSPFQSPCSQVRPALLRFMSIRISTILLTLAEYVAKPVKTHPRNTKNNQKNKNTHTHNNQKKSEDYYTVTSHIVLRIVLFLFFVFLFLFLWLCLCFFEFLMFLQGGRCKGKPSIFGHFRKRSEAIGNFGNRICRSPRRAPGRNQFESSSCFGLHTNTFN